MRVALAQLDGKLPNLALMRISAHHRARGDVVELVNVRRPDQAADGRLDGADVVYASAIFESTQPVVDALRQARPDAITGGTGLRGARKFLALEHIGIDGDGPVDYAIYPEFTASIGFTQRGCHYRCGFCVVPRKEGAVRAVGTIAEIYRGDPHARHLLLLDNDFFHQPAWRDRLREVREGGFRVCFTQGINVREIGDEEARELASVDYRDGNFKERRIYTAWDNAKDEWRLFRGLEALKRAGVRPQAIMVYVLVGYQTGETHADRDYRRRRLRDFGARPYPMPFARTRELVGFQRWCIGGYDKYIEWERWEASNYDPRKAAKAWAAAGKPRPATSPLLLSPNAVAPVLPDVLTGDMMRRLFEKQGR